MKKQSSRARAQSTPIVRHQLEHPVPTVIHDPEEKMTALGRFAHHAMLEPRRYLGWPVAIIGGLILAALVWRMANGVSSNESDVWTKLEAARTPSERVDLAKANPKSPAAIWAKLQAATGYFDQALADLPNNSEVALSALKKALDLFDQVTREAPHKSAPARVAALGRARALEMRNELPKAIEQYEHIANDEEWRDTAEAAEARRYAEALKDPQAVAFYKDLYAYQPTTMTLPPGGTETFPPGLGSGLPGGLLNPGPAARTPASKSASDLRDLMVPGRNEVVEPKAGTPAPGAAPKSVPPAPKIEAPKPSAMPSPGAPVAKPEAPKSAAVPNSGTPAPKPETPKPAPMPKSAPPVSKPEAAKPVVEPKANPPVSKPEAAKPAAMPKSAPPASKAETPKPVVVPKASNPPATKPEAPKPVVVPNTSNPPAPKPEAPKPAAMPKPNPPATKPESPKPAAMPKSNPPSAKLEAPKPVVEPKASNPPAAKPQVTKPAEKSKDLPDDVFSPKL
jgi:hypothetical protein